MRWKDYKIARERMVKEQLYDRGICDRRVLEAMLRVPRHVFLDRDAGTEAYSDHSFPIGFSQTMSQPFMVAYLAEQLCLEGDERVLEIGTGSGYQAAVLACLCREVYTIERVAGLAERSQSTIHDLLFTNIHVRKGDGTAGWPEYAPFDRVLLTAAARRVATALLTQLRDGGLFVGPVIKEDGSQEIVRLTRSGNAFNLERLGSCSFVPMIRSDEGTDRATPPAVSQGERYGR